MKRFHLERDEDISGVSGTGVVAEGVILSDGEAVLHWFGDHGSVSVYKNIEAIEFVHGHGGATKVIYED